MIRPAARRTAHVCQPLPGHDRPARPGASREHAHHDPGAERISPKVVVPVAKPKMLDERETVVCEHVRRIPNGIARFRTVTIAAEVRKNDAMPVHGECAGRAVFNHAVTRPAEAGQQDQRPAGTDLGPPRQFHAVAAVKSYPPMIRRSLAESAQCAALAILLAWAILCLENVNAFIFGRETALCAVSRARAGEISTVLHVVISWTAGPRGAYRSGRSASPLARLYGQPACPVPLR